LEVKLTEQAKKDLKILDKQIQNKIFNILFRIQDNFYNIDLKKLQGKPDRWRIRVGNYRIIFEKEKDYISIIAIKHRKEAY